MERIPGAPYPDPKAKQHKHGLIDEKGKKIDPSETHITSENPDPLFIEWVYIVDVENMKFHVLAHTDSGAAIGPIDSNGYRHKLVQSIALPLKGKFPAKTLEQAGRG